jgi:translocation and assembly module TamA
VVNYTKNNLFPLSEQQAFKWLLALSIMCLPLFNIQKALSEENTLVPKLDLTGVEGAPAENILLSTDLSRYRCSDSSWQLQRLLKRVKKQSEEALQALGYYQSKIELNVKQEDKCWILLMNVNAGKQVILNKVQIEVNGELAKLPSYLKMADNFSLKQGKPLKHADYQTTKTDIEVLAARYGFFNAAFTEHRLDIYPKKNQASAVLLFESGPRSYFGDILIDQSTYNKKLINQYITLNKDTPYDSQALLKQQQTLNGSGYFATVNLTADRETFDNRTVPISIKLEPIKQHSYQFGIGASTDTGPRVSFDYENRRLNSSGHDFSFNSSFSRVRSEITLDYGIPQGKAGVNRLDFQLGYLIEDTDSSEHESFKLAALRTRITGKKWLRTLFLEYLYEDFTIANNNQHSKLLMPGIRIQKTVADNTIFPRKGWHLNAAIRLARDEIISSTNLVQLTLSSKLIWPLPKGRVLTRLQLGASIVDKFEKLPASLRFFAGGDGSVRGFAYKSLGPVDDQDEVIGGKHLLVASLEYEYPMLEKWGLTVFIDSGNAFNDVKDYTLSTGAGFGLRWHSIIGPIRLDIARDVEKEHSPRLHLSMGFDL